MNERIKQLREYLGLSQSEFAKKISKTPGYISLVETGRSNISSSSMSLISQAFGVNPIWLETGEGEMFLEGREVAAADKEGIGKRIKSIREDKDLSVAKFAELIPCSKNHLSNVEKGKTIPSAKFVKSVADTFSVNYQWLLTGVEKDEEKTTMSDEETRRICDYLNKDSVAREVVLEAIEKDRSIWLKIDRVVRAN